MLAVGVDPSSDSHDAGFAEIGNLVLQMMKESDPEAFTAPAGGGPLDEVGVAATQDKAVSDLLLRANALPQGTLEPYRQLLGQQIPTTWPHLEPDLQTILVTAEFFGAAAPEGADLSGPLLGLSAACERLMCGPGMLFARIAAQAGGTLRTPVTLGTAAMCLKWCRKPKEPDQFKIQALVRADPVIDYDAMAAIGRELFDLNDFRISAAHTDLVTHDSYTNGRALILGSGDQSTPGLLSRLVQALGLG